MLLVLINSARSTPMESHSPFAPLTLSFMDVLDPQEIENLELLILFHSEHPLRAMPVVL